MCLKKMGANSPHRLPTRHQKLRTDGDKNTNLSPQKKKTPEYGEPQMLKHINILHCIPTILENSNFRSPMMAQNMT